MNYQFCTLLEDCHFSAEWFPAPKVLAFGGSFAPPDTATVIQDIFAIGFNHHSSDATARSTYALSDDQKEILLKKSFGTGLNSLTVLSTCNRTEMYGYGNAEKAESIYFELIGGSAPDGMIRKNGREAIRHIFKVAAGLDSQVIGDLEILGQFKQAFVKSKQRHALNNVGERLADSSLRAAKEVRSHTRISSGTISLSYAAVKFVKDHFEGRNIGVLIVGAGKFGSRIAKNLHDYYPQASLTICNRTREKAVAIVDSFGGKVADFENLTEAVSRADVIICCVNDTGSFVLNTSNVPLSEKAQMFVDMSIPLSIAPELGKRSHAAVVTLDDIGQVVNETLESRREDIPLAEQIIEKHIDEFCRWANVYDKSDAIVEWKKRLQQLAASCPYMSQLEAGVREKLIGKSIARFVGYVRKHGSLPDTEEIIKQFIKESEHALACQQSGFQLPPDAVCSCLVK
jgi:glutamyl-tRNA reductase